MKQIELSKNNVKIIGRTYTKDGVLKAVMSASGCEFSFTGKKLVIEMGCCESALSDGKECNFPRASVLVNGKFIVKKVIGSRKESFTVFESDTVQTVNVKIIKLSESAFSLLELYPLQTDDDAYTEPLAEKALKIEFIGDSITCGYGVDDSNIVSDFSCCAENAMKSYAYLTAEALDADYSMFSASGYGIISGYTGDGVRNSAEVLPPYYESLGFSYSYIDKGLKPQDIKWDFSNFVSDIVVINLGTNDTSFCRHSQDRVEEFEKSYKAFVCKVRELNPQAVIICTLGLMETLLCPSVKSVCEKIVSETGDSRLHYLELKCQDGKLGFSSNWHPSEDTHHNASECVADFIKTIL